MQGVQIHGLRRGLPCRLLLRTGQSIGHPPGRLHRLHCLRGRVPGRSHLCRGGHAGRICLEHRIQCDRIPPVKRFRSAGHPQEKGSFANCRAKENGVGVLRCLASELSVPLDCPVKLLPVLGGINIGQLAKAVECQASITYAGQCRFEDCRGAPGYIFK